MQKFYFTTILLLIISRGLAQNTFPSTGNVGIGTLSPQKILHLSGTVAVEQLIEATNDGFATLSFKGNGKFWHFSKRTSSEADAFKLFYNDGTQFIYPAYLTFTNGGLVGIGDESPQSKLQVRGGTLGGNLNDAINLLSLYSTGGSGGNYVKFNVYNYRNTQGGTDWTTSSTRLQAVTDGTNTGYMEFNPLGGRWGLAFGSQTSELMRITQAGSLGIGTTNPDSKLTLLTSTSNDGFKVNNNNSGWVKLLPNSLSAGSYNNLSQGGDGGIIFGSNSQPTTFGFVISPWSTGTTGLRIDQNGNVGIATANTYGYQLAVNGTAIFTKAKVKLYGSWPDYVFKNGYKLRPISEVENYIKGNNHLPDVPSAEDIKKNNLDLGDSQAILLRKIEELTLYIIEQNKKIEKLQGEFQRQEDLSKKLNFLEEQIKLLRGTK